LMFLIPLLLPVQLFSQEAQVDERFIEPYARGDQIFTMSAGLFIPLFYHMPNSDGFIAPNQSLGGMGTLGWSSFLTNRIFLGVNLSGAFSSSPQELINTQLPLTMQAGYMFLYRSFEIPVTMEAGIIMNKYDVQTYFGPVLKPGVSFYWVMDASWAFGLTTKYWWVPEIYFGDKKENTAFGNFTEATFSARYRF
jgi:hypothetical protein